MAEDHTQPTASQQQEAPPPQSPPEPLPTQADPRLVSVKEYSEHGQRTTLTGDGGTRQER
jgi:hypothetical protein